MPLTDMKLKYDKVRKMDKELSEKVKILSDKYNKELKAKGIRCTLSEREIKSPVFNFFDTDSIADKFFHNLSEKREKKLYKNKANRYDTLVLTFLPLDKSYKIKEPKTYAFITKSADRIAKGFAPKEKSFGEEKILKSIEKCIIKFLHKAENKSPEKACKSTFLDNLRYFILLKYSFQKTLFGKDRSVVEVSALLIFALIMIIAVSIIYLT